jgi:hypothetical protein
MGSMPDRSETVFADQPEATDRPASSNDGPGRGVEKGDDADRRNDQAVLDLGTSTTLDGQASDDGPTTDAPIGADPGAEPEPGPSASVSDVVGRLAPGSVLFHTDNEGCDGLLDGRAHPDWIEGQPGTGRNDDGTPTYGFAYNTGDTTAAEIDWRFVEQPNAPSGRCVLSMTLNHADDSSHAVRLFRRYDRNGELLPDDAYYSAWLYFPKVIEFDNRGVIDGEDVFGFWNVFQIKNDLGLEDSRRSLSALSFNAGKVPDQDVMSLTAYSKVPCGADEDCGRAFTIEQSDPTPIPTGRWVHFELHLLSRIDGTGRLEVWQDGEMILTYSGPTERPGTVRRTWSLTSMGHLHRTPSHSLFADDPVISTEPMHPELFRP